MSWPGSLLAALLLLLEGDIPCGLGGGIPVGLVKEGFAQGRYMVCDVCVQ